MCIGGSEERQRKKERMKNENEIKKERMKNENEIKTKKPRKIRIDSLIDR
jgi:hypothetical protein